MSIRKILLQLFLIIIAFLIIFVLFNIGYITQSFFTNNRISTEQANVPTPQSSIINSPIATPTTVTSDGGSIYSPQTIPGAKIALLVTDKDFKIIHSPFIRVEHDYIDTPYYNFTEENRLSENPGTKGIMPEPDGRTTTVVFHVSARKIGWLPSKNFDINSHEYSKLLQSGEKATNSTQMNSLSENLKSLVKPFASESILFFHIILEPSSETSSFDQVIYSNLDSLLLYEANNDNSKDNTQQKWTNLQKEFPNLYFFKVPLEVTNKLLTLSNRKSGLYTNTQSIIFLKSELFSSPVNIYYPGPDAEKNRLEGWHNYTGEKGFEDFKKELGMSNRNNATIKSKGTQN